MPFGHILARAEPPTLTEAGLRPAVVFSFGQQVDVLLDEIRHLVLVALSQRLATARNEPQTGQCKDLSDAPCGRAVVLLHVLREVGEGHREIVSILLRDR